MHLKKIFTAALLVTGLWSMGLRPAVAQDAAVQTSQAVNTTQELQKVPSLDSKLQTAPQLYDGELEDIGPQYVLQPEAQPKYFNVMSDWQIYRTDNATLSPANKGSTDVSVLSLQALVQSQEMSWFSDTLNVQARAGLRYQTFNYGLLSGRDKVISGQPVKDDDFMTCTPYGELAFNKDGWSGSVGLRYAAFTNDNAVTNGTFYQELVPYWLTAYQWSLTDNQMIQFQYDGDYRGTNTASGGLQPVGWNDRTDHAATLAYSLILDNAWVFQPSYRFTYSDYTNSARQRDDLVNTASFMVAYYFSSWASVRAFTSYEMRSSSEALQNYQNWNIGIGLNLSYSF
jgi:hypothetical protein